MLYIRYILFCFKVLFNLKHYRHFIEYNGDKAKNYRLELKKVAQKIKLATSKGTPPKQEHVFMSMFYECLATEEPSEKKEEFITLFCLLFMWWISIDTSPSEE